MVESYIKRLKDLEDFDYEKSKDLDRSLEERWIISRLGDTAEKMAAAIEEDGMNYGRYCFEVYVGEAS